MPAELKKLAIIGSTGSIGRQALEIVRAMPERFRAVALAAGKNLNLLTEQVNEFKPRFVSCADNTRLRVLACEFMSPENIVSHPEVDVVVMAISGTAGLSATLAAVKAGKVIALANKESLVSAGEIITEEAKKSGARILPVDSEHSAIWQCLNGEDQKPRRIYLTASGGPFRAFTKAQMARVSVEQALKHPSWKMGPKVTIDSATLMNKGLEVIEARWLFDMPIENITVLVHPQSIVHSMVEFTDGSMKAQLSYPDMRLPIQYALSYPERPDNPTLPRLDWAKIRELSFEPPDIDRFPCLKLAIGAGKEGGTCPAVLCAADEAAVALFLAGRLKFTDIARMVEKALGSHMKVNHPAIEDIIAAEKWANDKIIELAPAGTPGLKVEKS